jgi:maltooligosyltrehalose trehalohydrolase
MLFMGEEWGAGTPWQFFTDHLEPELAASVRHGRQQEFAAHGWAAESVPDPQDAKTFQRSKLDWTEPDREPHRDLLGWYRSLIALRRSRPELTDPRLDRLVVDVDEAQRSVVVHRASLRVVVNLHPDPRQIPVPGAQRVLLASDAGVNVDAAAVVWLPGKSVAVIQADDEARADPPQGSGLLEA